MKKSLSLLVLVSIFLISTLISFGQVKESAKLGDGTIVNITSSNENLYDSGCSIDFYASDDKIVANAYTNAFTDADSIHVKLYVERYENGKWISVASASDTNYDSDHVTKYITIRNPSPGKYRTYAIHEATTDGNTEFDITYTNSINVY